MNVNFGMLQKLKQAELQNNPALKNLQSEITAQTDIFTQAKQDYDKASSTGTDNSGGAQPQTFAQPTMSVEQLQDKMDEAQGKLEKLQATLMQEIKGTKGDKKAPEGENKEDKDKIQPKGFAGMMA